jgi:MFS family permease
VARFFQGAASAATWTCGLALVAARYPVRRVETMGYALIGSAAGAMLGPLAGGELFDLGGFHLPFIITAGLVCVDLLMRILLLPDRRAAASTASVPLRALLTDRAILIPAVVVLLAAFGWGIIEPLLPNELSRFGTDPAAIGLIFTMANIAYVLSTPAVSWATARVPVRIVSSSGVMAMAAILPLLGWTETIVPAGVALCLLAIAFAFTLIPTTAELGNAIDRRGLSCYAAVYAVYNIAFSLGMTATDSLASIAASRLSFFQVLLCVSAVLVLCVPWLFQKDARAAVEPISS